MCLFELVCDYDDDGYDASYYYLLLQLLEFRNIKGMLFKRIPNTHGATQGLNA